MVKPSQNPNETFLDYFFKLLGAEETAKLLEALRKPPSKYFLRINTLLAKPHEVVASLRRRGVEAKLFDPKIPEAIYVEVVEESLDEEEASRLKEVVVDRYTAEAVMVGANVYAPGVKRAKGVLRGDLVAIRMEGGFLVGLGEASMSGLEALTKRRGLAVKVLKTRFKAPSLRDSEEYLQGLVYPQSLPSMIAVRALDPKPGEKLIDLTAAPGGKLTHAFQLMEGVGEVVAIDRSPRKVAELKAHLERMKMHNVKVMQRDSRYLDLELPHSHFDAVIVDPPCSAIGVRPKLHISLNLKQVSSLAEYQKQFLKVASKLVKPGGRILYSTCTLTIEENERVVSFAVEACGLRVKEHVYIYGQPGLGAVPGAIHLQRFYPHIHDTPGFFIAVLERLG